jgi:hypothetical protein
MEDKKQTWQASIIQDPDSDDFLLVFPEGFLMKAALVVGDQVEVEQVEQGILLKKISATNSDETV